MKFSCFQFLLILLFDCDTYVDSSKAEGDLYRELLTSYSSLVRPVKNALEPVKVLMRLHLQQIIDVDEKNQVVELNAWLNYRWWDYRLSWNMSAYENITSIRVASDDNVIWIPDILLYNSVDKTFDSTYKSNLVVYNTGEVNWVPPGIFRLSCRLVVTWFPFDEQSCFLKFSSWTYHAGALDLHLDLAPDEEKGMDLSGYIPNGEWELISAPAVRSEDKFDCCIESYITINFFLNIRRRTLYYAFNVIIPSLLLSCMTLLAFCLPAHDMSEKIGFQTTILLSVCFFLTVVSELTPRTSEAVPLLGVFFSTLTIIVAISTAFTICVLNVRYRQPMNHRMSKMFQQVFLVWLPWVLLMRRPEYKMVNRKAIKLKDLEIAQEDCIQCVGTTTLVENGDCVQRVSENGNTQNGTVQNGSEKLRRIPTEQLFLERKEDYKFASMALDRLCLVLFTTFISVTVGAIFLSPPYLIA
uniref:Uncharacterized protein n=1 Tax=Acrobeloides nanus TaxID=290746 RepID=A0A914C6Q3_9BILA